MNINQQSEATKLFGRLNSRLNQHHRAEISEEELNRVRAYVVQSQRPLQSVRLLEKE